MRPTLRRRRSSPLLAAGVLVTAAAFGLVAAEGVDIVAARAAGPKATTTRRRATTKRRTTTRQVTSSRPVPTVTSTVPTIATSATTAVTTAVTTAATTAATTAPRRTEAPPSSRPCRPIRIMPLGDSLTAFPDSYRGPLYRRLIAEHHDVDFVGSLSWEPTGGGDPDGEGHGGFTIGPDASVDFQGKPANLADNVDAWIPAARPDVILLTIGANDLATGGAGPAQAPDKLRRLVARLQTLAPSAVLVLGDVPPARYDLTGNGIVKPLNDTARALADAATSGKVLSAPTFRRLLDAGFRLDTDTVDGQHFSVAGGIKFADAWYPTVVEALARATTC